MKLNPLSAQHKIDKFKDEFTKTEDKNKLLQEVKQVVENLEDALPREDTRKMSDSFMQLEKTIFDSTQNEILTSLSILETLVGNLSGAWIREENMGWAYIKSVQEGIPEEDLI